MSRWRCAMSVSQHSLSIVWFCFQSRQQQTEQRRTEVEGKRRKSNFSMRFYDGGRERSLFMNENHFSLFAASRIEIRVKEHKKLLKKLISGRRIEEGGRETLIDSSNCFSFITFCCYANQHFRQQHRQASGLGIESQFINENSFLLLRSFHFRKTQTRICWAHSKAIERYKFDIWIVIQIETDVFYCEELLAICSGDVRRRAIIMESFCHHAHVWQQRSEVDEDNRCQLSLFPSSACGWD